MVEDIRTFPLDAVTVTVINVGDLQAPYTDWLSVSPDDRSIPDIAKLVGRVRMPIQCFHVALPGASILVDASAYDFQHDHPWVIPQYHPPPGLLAGLAQVDVHPDEIATLSSPMGISTTTTVRPTRSRATTSPVFQMLAIILGVPIGINSNQNFKIRTLMPAIRLPSYSAMGCSI